MQILLAMVLGVLTGYLWPQSADSMKPLGDLFKTQIRQLSAALDLPASVQTKAPSADLWEGQTDEGEGQQAALMACRPSRRTPAG